MLNTRKHILVFFAIFGFFLVPVGNIMTIQGRFAKGDDSYIYLVDFDETAYDMYIQGYYPTDYTYADFRRDSIEGMVSHYVATDNNNFGAVVDTVENAVINDSWSAIKGFFQDAWIDLKSGVVTVEEGFTDDFKHELDGRFKSGGGGSVDVNGTTWYASPYNNSNGATVYFSVDGTASTTVDAWFCLCANGQPVVATYEIVSGSSFPRAWNGTGTTGLACSGSYWYGGTRYRVCNSINSSDFNNYYRSFGPSSIIISSYTSVSAALADFYGHERPSSVPVWNGNGYYSDTPTNYSINLPALPAIDWQSISNNNKTKYGVDFPDVNVSVDFQLPDMYYPKTVTYDVPYWLQNGDETPVDWVNVNFDDVTMPSVDLPDGDGTFFQNIFLALPVGFSALILGAMLCYLIFLLL